MARPSRSRRFRAMSRASAHARARDGFSTGGGADGFWQGGRGWRAAVWRTGPASSCAGGATVQVEDTAIPAVKIVTPKKHGDARGFFSETYNRNAFEAAGLDLTFVQDNHSFSAPVGTLRGLHFQTPPFAQDKLLRVAQGPHPRRRGRHPPLVADVRQMGRGRAVGGELAPAARARRLRPRLRHARARHRGALQDDQLLFAGQRPRRRVGRPGHRDRMAAAGRRPDAVGQGQALAAADRTRRSCSPDAHRRHGVKGTGRDLAARAGAGRTSRSSR